MVFNQKFQEAWMWYYGHIDLMHEASLTVVSVPQGQKKTGNQWLKYYFSKNLFLGEPRKLQTVDFHLHTVTINRKKKKELTGMGKWYIEEEWVWLF